ncbi:MAG TPA: SAM-dependent methyltransferase, partial [Polyangia bacterium]
MKRKLVSILERIRAERPDVGDGEALVARGRVRVGGRPIVNPRALVPRHEPLVVDEDAILRGTLKLRAALARFAPPVAGRVCLDVGAAAGGFTTALLEAGARRVYAVDVGHGQLVGRLRQDARVVVCERTNLADLADVVAEPIALVSVDLSYLSLARAAPQLAQIPLCPGAP